MAKIKLYKIDLVKQFLDHVVKISRLCELYDDGETSFSKELAVKLRVLFHSTDRDKSLFRKLKLEHLMFVDTSNSYDPKNLVAHHGLLSVSFKYNPARLIPRFENNDYQMVTFKNWWDSKKVIVDGKKNVFTRKSLVRELADTDGGAHVDSSLKSDYFDLSRANSLGWIYKDETTGKVHPLNDPVPPCIRQICYEVIKTFELYDLKIESKIK